MDTDRMHDFGLIAAILRPRDVALHPNFRSSEIVSVASLLGLLTTARLDEYQRECESDGYDVIARQNPEGLSLLTTVAIGMTPATRHQGAKELANRAQDPGRGPIEKTVCAVLGSWFFAESEQVTESIDVLARAMADVSRAEGPQRDFLLSVLLQNLALRRWNEGSEGLIEAQEAHALLSHLDVYQLPSFNLSKGVSWSSQRTAEAMRQFLLDANSVHIARLDKDWGSIVERVRQAPDTEVLSLRSRTALGLSQFLEDKFRSSIGGTPANFSDGGDAALLEALMHAEFSGHLESLNLRKLLGTVRYLSGHESGESWEVEDGLRFLRTSGSEKDFEYAVQSVKNQGPLRALYNEAHSIIANPPQLISLDRSHALLFESAVELLDEGTARRALDLVLAATSVPKPQRGRTLESSGTRLDYLWSAALKLSRRANAEVETASKLVEELPSKIADPELARTLGRLKGSVWQDDSFKTTVRSSLENTIVAGSASFRILEFGLELSESSREKDASDKPLDLQRIAELLTLELASKRPVPSSLRGSMEDLIRETMRRTRDNARRGMFTGGGIPECDLAVAYSLISRGSDLWGEIGSYLLDPRVQRGDKSAALRRLLSQVNNLPSSFVQQLAADPLTLLSATSSFLDDDINPFPDAVKLIAALGLLPEEDIIVLSGRLLSSRLPQARSEGVKTLQVIAEHSRSTDWLFATALSASFDADYSSRAEAAVTLASMRRDRSLHLEQIDQRLAVLLDEPGAEIPLLTLFGLRKTKVRLSSSLYKKIEAIAATHIHKGVRDQAALVLQHQGRA